MQLSELIVRTASDRGLEHFFGILGGGVPLVTDELGSEPESRLRRRGSRVFDGLHGHLLRSHERHSGLGLGGERSRSGKPRRKSSPRLLREGTGCLLL